jgi:hypothetical protein
LTDAIQGRPARIFPANGSPACAFFVAGLILGGCGTLTLSLPFVGPVPAEEAFQPRELRFRREVGSPDRYQAKYSIRVRNDLQIDETVTAELSYYCSGKEEGPPPRDRVIIWKQETERDLLEVRPKAPRDRQAVRKDHTRNWQPVLTPNTGAEPGRRGYRYIRINELGQILRAKATPFHFVYYDSLCYFWPVLPKHKVRPGDRWAWDVPVIVGREFTNNLMSLHARFHFVEMGRLRGRGGADGPTVAVIDYSYYGLLDTGVPIDATKMPPNTPGLLWRRHAVEGEGRAYLDIKRGKIIWKSEKYTATVEQKTVSVTRKAEDESRRKATRPGEPDVEHHRTVNTVEFVARLLAPGEVASGRPSRTQ